MHLSEIIEFQDDAFIDERGSYWTSWKEDRFKNIKFNHDKFSLSKKNVLRGFHGDRRSWKLVSCVYGEVFLVLVNVIEGHKDYYKSKSWNLSSSNRVQVLIPPFYASAHLCISNECLFHYKFSYKGDYPDVNEQFSIKWNDKKINIKWPIADPILSKRDK